MSLQPHKSVCTLQCYYWLYEIEKHKVQVASNDVTFIPKSVKSVNWVRVEMREHQAHMIAHTTRWSDKSAFFL
jgi:hypothetical protein